MTAAKRKEKMFSDYPDVVTVKQMCSMLGGIGMKTACNLHRPAATEAQPQRPPCPVRTAT